MIDIIELKKFEYTAEGCTAATKFLLDRKYVTQKYLNNFDGFNIVYLANTKIDEEFDRMKDRK